MNFSEIDISDLIWTTIFGVVLFIILLMGIMMVVAHYFSEKLAFMEKQYGFELTMVKERHAENLKFETELRNRFGSKII